MTIRKNPLTPRETVLRLLENMDADASYGEIIRQARILQDIDQTINDVELVGFEGEETIAEARSTAITPWEPLQKRPEQSKEAFPNGEPANGESANGETQSESGKPVNGETHTESGKPVNGEPRTESGEPANGATHTESAGPANLDTHTESRHEGLTNDETRSGGLDSLLRRAAWQE